MNFEAYVVRFSGTGKSKTARDKALLASIVVEFIRLPRPCFSRIFPISARSIPECRSLLRHDRPRSRAREQVISFHGNAICPFDHLLEDVIVVRVLDDNRCWFIRTG